MFECLLCDKNVVEGVAEVGREHCHSFYPLPPPPSLPVPNSFFTRFRFTLFSLDPSAESIFKLFSDRLLETRAYYK